MGNGIRGEAMATIRRVLAADYACDEADLLSDWITIVPHEQREGSRGFQVSTRPLQFVTTGNGVVIACHPDHLAWAKDQTCGMSRDDVFSASMIGNLAARIDPGRQQLHGPYLRYAASCERFRPVSGTCDAKIDMIADEQVWALENHPDFPHALSPSPGRKGSQFVAAVASERSRMIGVAAACEETAGLWQIGVDVIPEAQGSGIGRQVVGMVAQAILDAGGVPYYTAAASNISSRSTAIGLGFWPAWTDLYVTDLIRSAPE